MEFNLKYLNECEATEISEKFRSILSKFVDREIQAKDWPAVPCDELVEDRARFLEEVIAPFLEGWMSVYSTPSAAD